MSSTNEKGKFPYDRDSQLHFLPLVYFLPLEYITVCPTLRTIPRDVRVVVYSNEIKTIVESDSFFLEVADAMSALAFPHFGFRGWKEDYTGHFPPWKLSYLLHEWLNELEVILDWNINRLLRMSEYMTIPCFDFDFITKVMAQVVKRTIEKYNWQPMLDVVREIPCHEDFEIRNSNVKKDFLRKWNHYRSKRIQIVSLDDFQKKDDEENPIYEIADNSVNIAEDFESEDYVARFKARLSSRDMEILELRIEGYTYGEIANRLGYKNHSGVLKRIRAIAKEFEKYQSEQ